MLKIAIITGSTRPNRQSPAVAQWVFDQALKRTDATFELVDIADYDLPLLDEPLPPAMGRYSHDHTKRWAAKIEQFDGFVFVTPEYNHSAPAALKNALDYLNAEWANKAAGFVSYGGALGARAVEHLRGVVAELQIADVRSHVALSMHDDFESFTTFAPRDRHAATLGGLFDQVIGWSRALKRHREERVA